MKKIIFSTLIALLLAFVGCQNEELVNDNNTDHGNGKKVTLTAHIQGSADSRVALTPATDENSKPIVKVAWNESGETFKVYGYDMEESDYSGTPTWFTQIEDTNQFEGTLPESDNGTYLAVYGDKLEGATNLIQYNFSTQGGTLDELCFNIGNEILRFPNVLMKAEFSNTNPSITFQHLTAILKPTFKVGGVDIDKTIAEIVMGNVGDPHTDIQGIGSITILPITKILAGIENPLLDDHIYIHLPMVYIDVASEPGKYPASYTFPFTVTDKYGKYYGGTLTIPSGMSIEAGKFYTADIALTEVCPLPTGLSFQSALLSALEVEDGVTAIKFVANSQEMNEAVAFSGNNMPANAKCMIKETEGIKTLEIHTNTASFVFNTDCRGMFSGYGGSNAGAVVLNKLGSQIKTINFNNSINTSNTTSMREMFYYCKNLQSLDLSSFNTSNVTTMYQMFYNCDALATVNLSSFNTGIVTKMKDMFAYCKNLQTLDLTGFSFTASGLTVESMFQSTGETSGATTPIAIKVTQEGYGFLTAAGNTSITSSYAKYVQPDGSDWPTN